MREFFERLREQVLNAWSGLSKSQRIWVVALAGGTFAALVAVLFFATRPQFVELGRFDTQTAAQIRNALTDEGFVENTDFRTEVVGDRAIIQVNARRRNEISLFLSGEGLMGSPEKGFAIFEGFDLTTTDLEQKIKEIEALKSELRRMIRSYEQVEDVSITFPRVEESLFSDEEIPQTASAVLTLKPGAKLEDEQIKAVRNLIASGFPGLDPDNITLTDQFMNPLIPSESGPDAVRAKQQVIQRETAEEFERRIRTVLGPVLGADKFTVTVYTEFNWDAVTQHVTEYTSPGFEQLIESQQTEDEELHGEGIRPGGEPGVAANAPPVYNAVAGVGPVDYKRAERVVNYLSNKSVTERIQSPFIKRVTAAVAIDGIWKTKTDTQGNIVRTYEARDPAFIEDVRELVKSALGEHPERQDRIVVRQIQWDRTAQFAYEDRLREEEAFKRKLMYGALIAIPATALIFFAFAVWNRRRILREQELARQRELERQRALAAAEAGLEGTITLEEQERMEIQRRAQAVARQKPTVVADLLRTWLSEDRAA